MAQDVTRLNEQELAQGVRDEASWHNDYKDTAWVRVSGLDVQLSEGDIICVFSQYGEIEDLKLIRDTSTGLSRGFCFIKFEQFKSAAVTVDNFNGTTLLGRTLRVDHHREVFRRGKRHEGMTFDELLKEVAPGSYYQNKEKDGDYGLDKGVDVHEKRASAPRSWVADDAKSDEPDEHDDSDRMRKKKLKKEKKEKKEKKKSHKRERRDAD